MYFEQIKMTVSCNYVFTEANPVGRLITADTYGL